MFNLELPTDQTHYVHRAGRTGRMGAEGFVLSIAEPKEKFVLNRIGRQLGVDIVAADLQNGELVPDRGDRPGVSRQQRDRDGEEARGRNAARARAWKGVAGGGRKGRGGAQNYTRGGSRVAGRVRPRRERGREGSRRRAKRVARSSSCASFQATVSHVRHTLC